MKPNKSIDGLSTRGVKNTPKTRSTNKTTVTKKSATQNLAISKPKKQSSRPTIKESDNITANSVPSKEQTTNREQTVDDFLKPVQAFDFSEEGELKKSKDTVKDMKSTKQSKKKAKKEKQSQSFQKEQF